jgi:uncharacterized phage protein gp47/JayE
MTTDTHTPVIVTPEMEHEFRQDVIRMVEHAAGPEIIRAVREARAAFHPVFDAMTAQERANWIMGMEG